MLTSITAIVEYLSGRREGFEIEKEKLEKYHHQTTISFLGKKKEGSEIEQPKKNLLAEISKKVSAPENNDKQAFGKIDDIVDSFNESFKDYSREYIFSALKMNSFNITSSYLFLRDPQTFRSIYLLFRFML